MHSRTLPDLPSPTHPRIGTKLLRVEIGSQADLQSAQYCDELGVFRTPEGWGCLPVPRSMIQGYWCHARSSVRSSALSDMNPWHAVLLRVAASYPQLPKSQYKHCESLDGGLGIDSSYIVQWQNQASSCTLPSPTVVTTYLLSHRLTTGFEYMQVIPCSPIPLHTRFLGYCGV